MFWFFFLGGLRGKGREWWLEEEESRMGIWIWGYAINQGKLEKEDLNGNVEVMAVFQGEVVSLWRWNWGDQ